MTTKQQIIQAFYKSGRPVDVIDPDGWHMLMWNSGCGVTCVGMWQNNKPIKEVEWKRNLDGFDIQPFTSTAKFVVDMIKMWDEGWRIESINSARYNR